MSDSENFLVISDLGIRLQRNGLPVTAVTDVNLTLPAGKITCLVGESGCGKSLTAKAVLGLLPSGATTNGNILYKGKNLLTLSSKALQKIRGHKIAMIFQEPMTSLNPVLTVGEQVAEPLRLHLSLSATEAQKTVLELFRQVGIPSPEMRYQDYPHQLSGGMRQRVMIAMALSCQPDILLADEPTTALDVTIQNQILQLLRHESLTRNMAVLLITHDLGVVAQMADNIFIMYAGRIVESAPAGALLSNPLHPYTQGLLQSAPTLDAATRSRLPSIPGTVPSLGSILSGCPFAPRCSQKTERCTHDPAPQPLSLLDDIAKEPVIPHMVSCWHAT